MLAYIYHTYGSYVLHDLFWFSITTDVTEDIVRDLQSVIGNEARAQTLGSRLDLSCSWAVGLLPLNPTFTKTSLIYKYRTYQDGFSPCQTSIVDDETGSSLNFDEL